MEIKTNYSNKSSVTISTTNATPTIHSQLSKASVSSTYNPTNSKKTDLWYDSNAYLDTTGLYVFSNIEALLCFFCLSRLSCISFLSFLGRFWSHCLSFWNRYLSTCFSLSLGRRSFDLRLILFLVGMLDIMSPFLVNLQVTNHYLFNFLVYFSLFD